MKLTERQRELLEWTADPHHSRDFPGYYTAFPHESSSFKALARRGLVERHEWQRSTWRLTAAGHAALAEILRVHKEGQSS